MKKVKNTLKRIATLGLTVVLLTNSFPAAAFAAEIDGTEPAIVVDAEDLESSEEVSAGESGEGASDKVLSEDSEEINGKDAAGEKAEGNSNEQLSDKGSSDEENDTTGDAVTPSYETDEDADKDSNEDNEEYPAFEQSKSIDGVKVSVTADEGVFPEGATLSVERVTVEQEKQAEEAVEDERPADQNVAVSYTYDIKVLDKDGNEIEPADSSKVKVSFKLEEVADENLTTNVYHITEDTEDAGSGELAAEKLPVETDGDTATAETDGFSLYTVEFTYNNLQYVLPGDSEVELSEILSSVGLSGEVTEVSVSDSSMFSAEKNDNGEWIVTAHKAFSTDEWMKVTINGVVYEIKVTDNQALSGSDNYTARDGDVLTGSTSGAVTIADGASITLSDVTITGGIVCEGSATITLVGANIVNVTSDNLGFKKAGIQIGGSGTTLTINGDGSLTATGGSAAAGIGLGRTWDASVTAGVIVIEGGTVNASGDIGIGIGTVGNLMTATIDGISIKGGTVSASLGKGYIYYGSEVTIGYIKIYDGIEMVDASKITETVTYMHVENGTETDVTANKTDYFTVGVDGDRRIIAPKDDTDYTITFADDVENGTITGATTAKYMETVTINVTPDFGYRLVRLVVKDADNNDVASTGNTFLMPKGNVTVSAVFEQGTHGTTEFAWGYPGPDGYVTDATIYDGVTTVNLQTTGRSYSILKYDEYTYYKFRLDNNTYEANIPYAGGTGSFVENNNPTPFNLPYDGETGFYDITLTDVGNGKWGVSILPTAAQMDVVPDQTYTGSAITPEPLVIAGSLSLTKGEDYTYSYENNTNVGTATVRATFQGTYASLGYVEQTFVISTHIHVFTYYANGATITATCTADDCPLENHQATLTIAAPTGDLVYDGTEKAATLTELDAFNIATGLGIAESGITYYAATKNGNTYTKNGSALTDVPTDAGDYVAEITVQSKTVSIGYTIAQKIVTITGLSAQSKEYDGTATATVTGTATINGKVGSDNLSVVEGNAAFEDANVGTGKTVTFSDYSLSGAAVGNYELSAQPASVTADITQKAVTVTAKNQNVEVGGQIATGTAEVELSGTLAGHTLSAVTLTPSSTNVVTDNGTITPSAATIKDASGNDVTGNYNITYTNGVLTVTKVQVYISGVTASDKIYDGNANATITGTPVLKKVSDNTVVTELTVTPGIATFDDANVGAGKTVTFSGYSLTGDTAGNYVLSAQPASVTANITAKPLTSAMFSISPASYNHDGATHTPTVTVTDNGTDLVLGTDYVIDASSTTSAGSYGTYTVKVNGIGNYSGSVEKTWNILDADAPTASVTVGTDTWNTLLNTITFGKFFKSTQSVSISAADASSGLQSVSYFTTQSATAPTTADGVEALATSGWTVFAGVSGNSFTGSFSLAPNQKYVIYVKVVDISGNTTYVSSDGLVLDATAPSIAGVDNNGDYHSAVSFTVTDEYLSSVTLQKDSEAAQNIAVSTGSASGTASDLGSYVLTATDSAGNTTTYSFTISRADITIAAQNQSYTYVAGSTFDVSTLFTIPDSAGAPTYSVVTGTDAGTGAGTLSGTALTITKAGTIKISVATAATDYVSDATATATLTVAKAAGNASITVADVTYGTVVVPVISSTTNTGSGSVSYVKTGETATTTAPTQAGSYTATVTYEATDLYTAATASTTFTISPAVLNMVAQAADKNYGAADPVLTYVATGFQNGDTEAVMTGALSRAAGENVGTYAITQGTLGAGSNYTISFTGALLTISKADAVITIDAGKTSHEKKYGDNAFVLGGITTNVGNASLTYEVTSGTDVVRVSSVGVVTLLKPGTATITVSVPGTENYNAAVSQTVTVTVSNGDAPKTKPSSTMSVGYSVDKVSAVSLPAGWTWSAADRDKTLTAGGSITVTAEYAAADKDYYNGGLTATVTITRQSKPSGGDSNNGNNNVSDDSNNNNSNTSDNTSNNQVNNNSDNTEQTDNNADNTDQSQNNNNQDNSNTNNNTNDNHTTETVDDGKPFIEGHPDEDGWDVIKDKIQDAISEKLSDPNAEGMVLIDMNGSSVVPGDVLNEIKGQDVTVVFDLGDGIKWTINGMDVTGDDIRDIDFAVTVGTSSIPVDVINNVTGERYSIQITLAHEGDFGFTATLSIDMDAKNAGLYANLFYYNTITGELEFICASEIGVDGMTDLTFTHASDYTIIIDEEPMDGSVVQSDVLADESDAAVQVTGTQDSGTDDGIMENPTENDVWNPWWIIVICGVIIAIGFGGFYVIRKKQNNGND